MKQEQILRGIYGDSIPVEKFDQARRILSAIETELSRIIVEGDPRERDGRLPTFGVVARRRPQAAPASARLASGKYRRKRKPPKRTPKVQALISHLRRGPTTVERMVDDLQTTRAALNALIHRARAKPGPKSAPAATRAAVSIAVTTNWSTHERARRGRSGYGQGGFDRSRGNAPLLRRVWDSPLTDVWPRSKGVFMSAEEGSVHLRWEPSFMRSHRRESARAKAWKVDLG